MKGMPAVSVWYVHLRDFPTAGNTAGDFLVLDVEATLPFDDVNLVVAWLLVDTIE